MATISRISGSKDCNFDILIPKQLILIGLRKWNIFSYDRKLNTTEDMGRGKQLPYVYNIIEQNSARVSIMGLTNPKLENLNELDLSRDLIV